MPGKPNYYGSLSDYKKSVAKPKGYDPTPVISAPSFYGVVEQAKKQLPQVLKESAIDLGSMAAGGVAGKVIGRFAGKAASSLAGRISFGVLSPKTMSQGGKVSKTFTPMGQTLRSTKILSPAEMASKSKGLYKIASNRANEIGSQIGATVAKGTSQSVRVGATGVSILRNQNTKPASTPKVKKK